MSKSKETDKPGSDATPTPTHENTPLPGGGSWRWDINLPGWVDVNAPAAAADLPAA